MTNTDALEAAISEWLLREPGGDRQEVLKTSRLGLAISQRGFRKRNEDRTVYIEIPQKSSLSSPLSAVLVADGMGGMVAGDRAASMAVAAFATYLALGQSYAGLKSLLIKAITYANEKVYAELRGHGGTTFSAILYGQQGAIGVNVGDSRIYRYDGKKLYKLTIDDTLGEHFKLHRKNVDEAGDEEYVDNRLAQFLGMGIEMDPHIVNLLPYSSEEESFYIITSDGAHFLGEDAIQRVCKESEYFDIPRKIIDISTLLGSTDNASAVICPKQVTASAAVQNTTVGLLRIVAPGREFFAPRIYHQGNQNLRKPDSPTKEEVKEIVKQEALFPPKDPAKEPRKPPQKLKEKKVLKAKISTRPIKAKESSESKKAALLFELLPNTVEKERGSK